MPFRSCCAGIWAGGCSWSGANRVPCLIASRSVLIVGPSANAEMWYELALPVYEIDPMEPFYWGWIILRLGSGTLTIWFAWFKFDTAFLELALWIEISLVGINSLSNCLARLAVTFNLGIGGFSLRNFLPSISACSIFCFLCFFDVGQLSFGFEASSSSISFGRISRNLLKSNYPVLLFGCIVWAAAAGSSVREIESWFWAGNILFKRFWGIAVWATGLNWPRLSMLSWYLRSILLYLSSGLGSWEN